MLPYRLPSIAPGTILNLMLMDVLAVGRINVLVNVCVCVFLPKKLKNRLFLTFLVSAL